MLGRLRGVARALAERFSLPLRSLEAENPRVKRRYGICYDDGSIRIRLRHVRTRELLKYSGLVDTLCHELAHLRHFDHGPQFWQLYRRILGYARRQGIYDPVPRAFYARGSGHPAHRVLRPLERDRREADPPPKGPLQLELFGDGG